MSPLTELSLLSIVLSVLSALSSIISRQRVEEVRGPGCGLPGMLGTGGTISELLVLAGFGLLVFLLTIDRGLTGLARCALPTETSLS